MSIASSKNASSKEDLAMLEFLPPSRPLLLGQVMDPRIGVFTFEWEALTSALDPAKALQSILDAQKYEQASDKPIRVIFTKMFRRPASHEIYDTLATKFGISHQFFREHVDGVSISWSRFLFKKREPREHHWGWHSMSMTANFNPSKTQFIIFVDAETESLRKAFVDEVGKSISDIMCDPFRAHLVLARLSFEIANQTVWDLRDCVCEIEARRQIGLVKSVDYHHMHDLARHIIHGNEMLDAAIETIQQMRDEHAASIATEVVSGEAQIIREQTTKLLRYREELLKRLRLRSHALNKRLSNEINLALNLVAQETGKATLADAAQMKTISLVTLIFLPATTVSTIFGMNFFDFDSSSNSFFVSQHFWVFWIFAIPMTAGFIALWYWLNGWGFDIIPEHIRYITGMLRWPRRRSDAQAGPTISEIGGGFWGKDS
ncbi:hypothetical protein BJ508DRAFT_326146 [Ascobolus immersus RN42]|uniref:Cora-domain-containing protein n=1 Tax=Ascobolus immersus RN42 TaxID=1160509 RepID=A0A3N4I6H6_ASCIM|nr:hypothetical protein BJ508DRAFT_326146 [Ascobolus immersus RN42]